MARLVDYGYEPLNTIYDALPFRGKIKIICGIFDAWVRGNGSVTCSICKLRITEIGGMCPNCNEAAWSGQ